MRVRLPVLAILVILAGCRRAAPPDATRPRPVAPLFNPAEAHALLDTPERDKWQKPGKMTAALELKPGETVADIGAGSGYLLPCLSRAVGKQGKVIAEEIQQEYMPALRSHADRLKNVKVVLGTAADPKLSGKVDAFVLLTVYHEVQQPVEFLQTLRRYAGPAANLAIIDFDARRKGEYPAPEGHEVAESDVIAEARTAGWKLVKKHEFLGSQFFLVFALENHSE